jgi:hypothetical protein
MLLLFMRRVEKNAVYRAESNWVGWADWDVAEDKAMIFVIESF